MLAEAQVKRPVLTSDEEDTIYARRGPGKKGLTHSCLPSFLHSFSKYVPVICYVQAVLGLSVRW